MYIGKLEESYFIGNKYLNEVIISLLLNAFSFYAIYFTFPRIIAIKNKILVFSAVAGLVLVVTGLRLPAGWGFWKFIGNLPEKELVFQWVWVWNELRMVIITGIYAILIRYMINAFETQKLRDELINQRQANEIALLKSQINPHFFFNTLNNIYSLVYQKSDEAPDAVVKLSSIMRYALYDASAEKIPLEKEIEYLKSYIELQRLRINQTGLVTLNIEGNPEGISIAPMLLIPFVESAFKFCSKTNHPAITIVLKTEQQLIIFELSSCLEIDQQTTEKIFTTIGLSKIKRRLELIYPDKNNLSVKVEDDQLKVILLLRP